MPIDLLASTPRDLLAGDGPKDLLAPQPPKDLLADEGAQAPSFLEHMGGLLKNTPMIGTIQPDMVPSRITDQMAIGAALVPNQLETAWLDMPDNLAARAQPETEQRLRELKGDRVAARAAIKEIQAPDNAVARAVGDAAQSVPASVVSVVPAAMGLPVAPALAAGLGANYVTETASDFTQRRDEFSQDRDAAWASANLHGAVATGLEMLPLHAGVKYMKGAAPLGKTALKVGVGEGVQEGLTQAFDDAHTNLQGLTAFDASTVAERAAKAALQGLLMAPMMGPVGHLVRVGQEYGANAELRKTLKAVADARKEADYTATTAVGELQATLLRDLQGYDVALPVPEDKPDAGARAEAALVKEQMRNGLPVGATEEGKAYGAALDAQAGVLQRAGLTLSGEELPANPDEGGVSEFVQRGRQNRYDPSFLPMSQRQITFSATDEDILGLTLEQVGELPAGSVTAVGGKAENFPAAVFQPAIQSLHEWVQKYMPDARIVLNLEQFDPETAGQAFGQHIPVVTAKGITHVITPMDMTNIGKHGYSDSKTAMAFMTSLTHEFGHALKDQAFYSGLQGLGLGPLLTSLRREVQAGQVGEVTMAALLEKAPEEGRLLARWQELRSAILKGELTAVEFMDNWVGTRKLANDTLKERGDRKSLYTWARERMGSDIAGKTALELIQAMGQDPQTYLSFDEFMAEQFSRAAYSRGDLATSSLGKLFATTLERMRNLFRDLKSYVGVHGERVVQPGETFASWLEKQTLRAGGMRKRSGKAKLAPEVQAARQSILDKILQGDTPAPPPEQVAPPKDIEMAQPPTQERVEEAIRDLVYTGAIDEGKGKHRMLIGMVKRGQFVEARAKIEEILGETLNWDRDYVSKVYERLPNKEKIKAETLQATLRMQDIKLEERTHWEKFLQQFPNGFGPEDARAALLANVLPLTMEPSLEYAQSGIHVLDALNGYPSGVSIVWEAPFQTPGSWHFPNPNYLMHSRRADLRGERFILELQSDVFQKRDWETTRKWADIAQEKENLIFNLEHAELLLEEIASDQAEGKHELSLTEASLRALGYPPERARELYATGSQETMQRTLTFYIQAHEARLQEVELEEARLRSSAETGALKQQESGWLQRLVQEEVAEGFKDGRTAIYFPAADTVAEIEGWPMDDPAIAVHVQPIYQRYKKELPKYLRSRYNAQEVRFGEYLWYKVDPSLFGEKVYNWDRDNPMQAGTPEITLTDFAGMAPEDFRKPERVAEASGLWARLDTESPYFKRWFGASKLAGADGKPLRLWRGVGNRVSFLDKTTRGGLTGVQSARKAFWFTDNPLQAGWYADQARVKPRQVLQEKYQREGQKIREKLEDLRNMLGEMRENGDEKLPMVLDRIRKLQGKLDLMQNTEGMTRPAQPVVQEFFLRMENPLVKDGMGQSYDDKLYTGWLNEALAGGYDGLVIKNTFDPLEGTVYAVFEPEQAKLTDNIGTFDPTDELHWDRDSVGQEETRKLSKVLQTVWSKARLRANNLRAKAVDNFIQLQQAAAAQPDELFLNLFVKLAGSAETMKNNLQYDAEETSKRMASMVYSSPQTVKDLHRVLDKEWRSEELQSTLVGKDGQGNVVWGGEAGVGPLQYNQVVNWEVQDSLKLRKFMLAQGVDVTTERGGQVLDLYLRTRNTFLKQFKGLEITLRDKATTLYENAPNVLGVELHKIKDLMAKLRTSPFVPQGNFGNYVVIVQKDQGFRGENGRRFVTIRKTHYERQEDFQQAYVAAQKAARGDSTLKVKSRVLEDRDGLPMALPSELLEKLAETGAFTDEQIELMADMMVTQKFDKIAEKYLGAPKVDGANGDFGKVFADFTWHNSNYIWKMYYRSAFNSVLAQQRTEIRRLDARKDVTPEELLAIRDRKQRNLGLMEKAADYMLHPPAEFQQARLLITLVYLAYNPLTAAMNFSTQLNTWAAVTSEYGELNGNKLFARGLKEAARYFQLDSRLAKETDAAELRRLNELKNLYEKAIKSGVIDQSYAYFLAGQANTSGGLAATSSDRIGQLAHAAMETGMFMFRSVEKANRLSSLIIFYEAERGKGSDVNTAYGVAVQKTNLLQNSFSASNKPAFARGKKAILFMFSSFAQHMAWITSGGYERASRAHAASLGRKQAAVWHGTTMKLWVLYFLLAGLGGVPFGESILQLVKFLWRNVFGQKENVEIELRKWVESVGLDHNVVMHGRLHNVGGFDLSGKFGLGRLVPGADLLTKGARNPAEWAGNSILAFSGPAGGFYQDLWNATAALAGGKPMDAAKAMPGELGFLAKAMDAALKQEMRPTAGITAKDGTRMTFDVGTGEFRDLTTAELAGMAIGATPTMVSENREMYFLEGQERLYWMTRRSDLLDKYRTAVRTEDEAAREKISAQIQEWNESELPSRGLRITGQDRARSIAQMRKQTRMREIFGADSKKSRGVVAPVEELYKEGGE